jgi:3-phenylpropionate/trans-cinnamate dioxygenase ferredoxin component
MAFEKVASLDDLAVGTAMQVELGGEPICVVRMDDDLVAACHDTCSHEEYPLHEGWVGTGEIECALHGSTFDLTTGAALTLPATKPIPVYAAKVDDGAVWVDIDQQLNDAPVPRH